MSHIIYLNIGIAISPVLSLCNENRLHLKTLILTIYHKHRSNVINIKCIQQFQERPTYHSLLAVGSSYLYNTSKPQDSACFAVLSDV